MPRRRPSAPDASGAPTSGGLADRFGRVATDLRLSLTDKCNLRCTYCMPAEGMQFMPTSELLTAEEITRLVDVGVRLLGVRELRLTGGEPLMRRDLVDIIGGIRALHDLPISLTTNGIGFDAVASELAEAGLTRVNVSLDTLDPETFRRLTRRPGHERVLAGIRAARDAGLTPVKVNAVLMPGINDHEAVDLLRWALAEGLELRFIEQMPLGGERDWELARMLTAGRIRELLSTAYDLVPHHAPRDGAPAERWTVRDQASGADLGTVGIIASVSEPFCGDCRRTRITAEGRVRSCLFSHDETDLRSLLRDGSDDEAIAQRWREAMWGKPRAHGKDEIGLHTDDFVQPERTMSAIGG
ncbi:MAG: GTP 3',8-cyclase MoaA [Micrococcales bacterium]|nr:GTP 3',8-cyclase MoaA [Micrococcales bacterium]